MEDDSKERSEEYYAELSVHRSQGDANAANAEGTIFPSGEPVEGTGRYAAANEEEAGSDT